MFIFFYPIFFSNYVIFPYSISPFNICQKSPLLWKWIKFSYIILYLFSSYIFANNFYPIINKFIFKFNLIPFLKTNPSSNLININKSHLKSYNNSLDLYIGENSRKEKILIPEKGLYQNILITGTIGSRQDQFSYVSFY